jgi:formylglycine-generating enzyme required for sulfatase activity
MSDVFICYSRTDATIAERVAGQLRAQGWSVFLDVQTHVGKRWHKEIEKELHAAKAVVVLWSVKSRDSDFVLEEAEYGKRKELLFPAFIEQVEYPYGFGRIQTANLIGWMGDRDHPGLTQLLTSLRLHLKVDETPPAPIDLARPLVVQPNAAHALVTQASPSQTFRHKLKIGGEGPQMVVIPSGRFLMGSPPEEPERSEAEGPQHEVQIKAPFAMGVYAVTFDEYDQFCSAANKPKPSDEKWGRGKHPVIKVSWNDAQTYCKWLTKQSDRVYRLPSEAEWEYACRAGTITPFHFGESSSTDQANCNGNYPSNRSTKGIPRKRTVPVGSFAPNAFGLYDMHGNVSEWCWDEWDNNYHGAPTDGSCWEKRQDALARVLRGGSWFSVAAFARSAARDCYDPDVRSYSFGFRVLCESPIE